MTMKTAASKNSATSVGTTSAPSTPQVSKPETPFCDRLKATDNWNPGWDAFYELDPAWTEKFMDMGVSPMLSGVLDAKTVEFLAIAVDASCTHMYAPGVRRHIRKALELGATAQEITAVLQCVSVLGIHTMSLSAPILQEELAFATQRKNAGPGERGQPNGSAGSSPARADAEF